MGGIALWWPRTSGGPRAGPSRTATPGSPTLAARGSPTPTTGPASPTPTPTRPAPPFPSSIHWQRVSDPGKVLGGPGDQNLNRVVATGSEVVAVGWNTAAGQEDDAAVWASSDRLNWALFTPGEGGGPGDQGMASVEVLDGHFVAVGSTNVTGTDQDGAVWTAETVDSWHREDTNTAALGGLGNQEIRRLVRHGGASIAVGVTGGANLGTDAAVWRFDGQSSTKTRDSSFVGQGRQEMWSIAALGPDLYAAGSDGRGTDIDAAVWRQQGKTTWEPVPARAFGGPGDQFIHAIVRTDSGLVAVGFESADGIERPLAWTSPDGLHWTRHRMDSSAPCQVCEVLNVTVYRRGLVAVGYSGVGDGREAGVWMSGRRDMDRLRRSRTGRPGKQVIKGITVFRAGSWPRGGTSSPCGSRVRAGRMDRAPSSGP